jgi:hypothetical protein
LRSYRGAGARVGLETCSRKCKLSWLALTGCSPFPPIGSNLASALRFSSRPGGRTEDEDGMEQACYSVERFRSQWIVSVSGAGVLTFKTKRAAVRAARRAMVLLHRDRQESRSAPEADANSVIHDGPRLDHAAPKRS